MNMFWHVRWWLENGLGLGAFAAIALAFVGLVLVALIANFVARWIVAAGFGRLVRKTRTRWDDALMDNKVFHRLSHVVPALILYWFGPAIVPDYPQISGIVEHVVYIYLLVMVVFVVNALLKSIQEIYRTLEVSRRMPIHGVLSGMRLMVYLVVGVLMVSVMIGKDPWTILAGMGAMTAVLLFVFRDAILGFVAGIHLSTNNMVHIGDWIEMPKYDADGDVVEVGLTTIKVQNWDKTITTIPTYALITDSFKNWRGMSESGGRRIKRCVHIDMSSIRFLTPEMTARFKKIQYIHEYMEQKEAELEEWNRQRDPDGEAPTNRRRLTNIGTFRAYLTAYLRNHPKIHQDMTFLVRHLQPTPQGLPIEIYVFSNDQVWANYEGIQADIFDHVLAVIPEFDLRVFQNPSGADFVALTRTD